MTYSQQSLVILDPIVMFDGFDSDVASNEPTCDQDLCAQDNFDVKKVHRLLAM
jgi:hypothetical protein